MENSRIIKCFIASPGDTTEERKICDDVMREINTSLGSALGFRLETRKWEKDIHPSIGTDGQAVINEQIELDYDIFIGIMYTRFGSPTPRAESGTEEEFDRAVSLHGENPDVEIMFYFNDAPLHPSQIDLEQYAKVKAFKEKVKDSGCLYWNYDGPKAFEDCLRQHLQMRLTEIFPLRQETKNEKDNTCDIREFLANQLIQRRKCQLMIISDELFPDGNLELYNIDAVNDVDEKKSVREIVEESWSREKNHLMIEGEGGIGKTVTLLSLPDTFVPHKIPSVYIQLHELKGVREDETLEEYIKSRVFHDDDSLFQQFHQLTDEPWEDGPRVLLLLDGFNEIAPARRFTIGQDINRWAERPGVQVITSSRYDIHSYVPIEESYGRILLQPLAPETIQRFLSGLGIDLPRKGSKQWEIINHPLMLTLYAQTKVLEKMEKTDVQAYKKSNSAGSIIWNYLQREIWRYRGNMEDVMKCVLAAEFIAPYVAWRMQKDSLFFLDEDAFWEYCHTAYDMVSQLEAKQLPPHLRKVFRKNKSKYPEKEDTIGFIKEELRLFVDRGDTYSLMHQQFRDALAALHLINVSYSSTDLPTEWKYPIDFYVLNFVYELATQEEVDRLWELNRNSSTSTDSSTLNMLELQKRQRKCDFTELNFSGVDLSKVSLFPYRFQESLNLLLPKKSELCEGLSISRRTFYPSGHSGPIRAIAMTPDGKRCVSGADDNTIRCWDLDNGNCIRVLEGHKGWIRAIAMTPDGKRCISGASDNTIRCWDLDNGNCIRVLEGHKGGIRAIAMTLDGKRGISGASDNTIRCWDLDSGNCIRVLEGHKDWIRAIAMTPDGKRCVSGASDNTIRCWDLDNGNCIRVLEEHNRPVNAIAMTPDGKRCVSGASDNTIRCWDLDNGNCIRVLEEHKGWIRAIAMTPDGKRCVSGASDNTIRCWDLDNGNCIRVLEGQKDWIRAIAMTPDGKRCISGASDNTIRCWDLDNGNCIRVLEGHKGAVVAIAMTPDGKRCVSGADDNTIRCWDLDNGKCIRVLEGHKGAVFAIAMTPDGKRCVSGSWDNTLRIWDLNNENCISVLEGHKDWIRAIAMTPDGKRCVSGADDNTIRCWDLDNGKCIRVLEGQKDWIRAIAMTPDGKRCISGASDNTIRCWDLDNGNYIRVLEGHKGWIQAIAMTPDGKRCVSGASDNTIRLWDLDKGTCITAIEVLPLIVIGIDFSKSAMTDEFKENLRLNGAIVPTSSGKPSAKTAPSHNTFNTMSTTTKRFAVGFSFPGACRSRVKAIADYLAEEFTRERILYDKYHEAEFARPDLDIYFQELYKNQTELVAVFICNAYNEREWCGVEWRALRSRMNGRDKDSIMLLKPDEGMPDGLFGNVDGYVDITEKTDREVADLIIQRYKINKA